MHLMGHANDPMRCSCIACPPTARRKQPQPMMDGPHSVVFDEAENRLHAQKAVMRWCLGL